MSMETILEFFKYLIVRFWIFIEKGTVFKLWNPFLDFLERFRKYMSDDKFEIVKYIVIVLLIIVIMLLFRLIYCKFFLKEDFKNEFTYVKDFFHPSALMLNELEFDYGTMYFIFISIGCLISIALTFIGFLVHSRYLVVSICLFIISALIIIKVIKTNINELGLIKGIVFTLVYTSFFVVTNVVYIASIICFCFLIIFWNAIIFTFLLALQMIGLAKDSDVFEDYGMTYCDYHDNQREDYKCEGKDPFGNIILKDKDGNEILARKDKKGNIRRIDNNKYLY